MVALNDVLRQIAAQLDLEPDRLIALAESDTIPPYYGPQGEVLNPVGIPFKPDGQILYALVSALPDTNSILELGTNQGGSAMHMLQAILDHTAWGHLTTVDISPSAGKGIPMHLWNLVLLVLGDINVYVQTYSGKPFDFIYEDGSHDVTQVTLVYQNLPRLLRKGGVIISHDTSTGMGQYIRSAIAFSGFTPVYYDVDGSPCGFSVLRYG